MRNTLEVTDQQAPPLPLEQKWAEGYGVIKHTPETRKRICDLLEQMPQFNQPGARSSFYELLSALDRVCSAAMWLVVHETYACNVYLDGRPLGKGDFKPKPDGHTGGSLNMVPAYAGYLAANVISGFTRGWLMGQGHCVAAVDSLNLIVGNMTKAHAARYSLTDDGLSRYVRDFYSYLLRADGQLESPLGSHVNPHTAGGLSEGGYLGFAELQYIHMPLPGERLVVFLSDGAFEEQRGSDWAARWWRNEDSGWVTPIMIQNGRRIDQRTTMSQQGGADWLCEHLRINGFDPFVFDGRDPAAFVWAILEMERRLALFVDDLNLGKTNYPVRLPYGIAIAPKGSGFPGEGTNLAHNLPLLANPHADEAAARRFNDGARRLWVSPEELRQVLPLFQEHSASGRVLERDNPLVNRNPVLHPLSTLPACFIDETMRAHGGISSFASPMQAVDEIFSALVQTNPHLRPRVGNPDEMRSNRLTRSLEILKFRVTDPEPGIPESIHGAVITALNEEAVVSAALANKGGINLAHTYEAFGPKMLGAVRQEVIFAENCVRAGRPQKWLSVPIIMTSHTWENGKNEHSHQDPTFAEAMMGESFPHSRVLFPLDFNTAAAATAGVYNTRGQIWTMVIPKADGIPNLFTPDEARQLLDAGAMRLNWAGFQPHRAKVLLAAVGAHQLVEVLRASRRLTEFKVPHVVAVILEPGRLNQELVHRLTPPSSAGSVVVTHTRPHIVAGILSPLHNGKPLTVLGYRNKGGTLDTPGMLMVNGCTWAHIVRESAKIAGIASECLLTMMELKALDGQVPPYGQIIPLPENKWSNEIRGRHG